MNLRKILEKYALNNSEAGTDKDTVHDYINGFYENAFEPLKTRVLDILEIGIYHGASLKLWKEYFINAKIYGADIYDRVLPQYRNMENVQYIFGDAYAENFLNNDLKFDIIIDDGPHTLQSQVQFIRKYHNKLKENSLMVIEDIADISYINILKNEVPNNFTCEVVDLRKNKNRFDDLMLIIRN